MSAPPFTALEIDDYPELLQASYRLRYQVYCSERLFLPADDYPDEIETDVYDEHAVHLGVLNAANDLVATARLVRPSALGLPMFEHCRFWGHLTLGNPDAPVVEISRLSVSRQYNRRSGDGYYGLEGGGTTPTGERRREGGEIVMALYGAVYQSSKRRGYTHWLAATERSLQRLLTRYSVPFVQIGPETDYFGMVAPYVLDLACFDLEILGGHVPALRNFLVGLEPRYQPALRHAS